MVANQIPFPLARRRSAIHTKPDSVLPDIERQLQEALAVAREAWAQLAMDEVSFVEHLARCHAQLSDESVELRDLHVADLFLAWACGRGDALALAVFDK